MPATKITDHAERALERVLLQYKDSPRLRALIELHAGTIQELENAAFDFYTKVALPTANGEQLDRIGAIVGQLREGRSDAEYRTWIEARIALNTGSGTVTELLRLFEGIVPPGALITVEPSFPAGFSLSIGGSVLTEATLAAQLAKLLQLAKAGGVRALLHWQESADAALFRFGSGPGFDVGVLSGVAE